VGAVRYTPAVAGEPAVQVGVEHRTLIEGAPPPGSGWCDAPAVVGDAGGSRRPPRARREGPDLLDRVPRCGGRRGGHHSLGGSRARSNELGTRRAEPAWSAAGRRQGRLHKPICEVSAPITGALGDRAVTPDHGPAEPKCGFPARCPGQAERPPNAAQRALGRTWRRPA